MQLDPKMTLEATVNSRDPEHAKTFQFAIGDMPEAAILKILRYGATRIFSDTVGGMEPEEKIKAVEAMIERFKKGEIGRQARASVDSLTKEKRKIVGQLLRAKNPDGWKKIKDLEDEEKNAKLDELAAKNPKIEEMAKAELKRREAEAKKLGDIELDI